MLKLKQYFCKHNYVIIAKHQSVSENLWRCNKCGIYYVQHWGLGVGYKCRLPKITGWIELDK